jgi:hypothetical protein
MVISFGLRAPATSNLGRRRRFVEALVAGARGSHLRGRNAITPPIALPGRASLQAALHPAQTDALYFVARGDGSSHFSRNLNEHNRAVNRYQK